MESTRPRLSLLEKVMLLARICYVLTISIPIINFYGLIPALRRGIPLRFWIMNVLCRITLGHFSPRQVQFLHPSTMEVYMKWVHKKNVTETRKGRTRSLRKLSVDIEGIGAQSSIMWVGNRKKATKVVFFLHGGGYFVPANSGHFSWCWNAYVNDGPGAKAEVAVAMLQYTLAPAVKFPQPLREAAIALKSLLASGISPGSIIMGGDSAGGNLTVQLIQHLINPQPDIPRIDLNGERFAGVFLVSPSLSTQTDTASFAENDNVDMISASILTKVHTYSVRREDVVGKGPDHPNVAMPLHGSLEWLSQFETITPEAYLTAGRLEVFRDDIVAFAKALRAKNPEMNVLLEVAEKEAHDYILMENVLGVAGPCDATQRMKQWATACFQL